MELFRKHNYHPLSGCLPVFFQLPIFIGLYRALMVDVELRGASLLGQGVRWCSNLAAPDMLFYWGSFWDSIGWEAFNTGYGMFYLGPYFNILPLVTIALFIIQQKMFMPPPTDDQAKMQQNMMTFMMLFMGLLFFKVASGLCLYFIASSIWGVAEKQLLPKKKDGAAPATVAATPTPAPRRESGSRKPPKQRPQKKKRKR
jgi:YidC/Oxa1 family membrane protein insertase